MNAIQFIPLALAAFAVGIAAGLLAARVILRNYQKGHERSHR